MTSFIDIAKDLSGKEKDSIECLLTLDNHPIKIKLCKSQSTAKGFLPGIFITGLIMVDEIKTSTRCFVNKDYGILRDTNDVNSEILRDLIHRINLPHLSVNKVKEMLTGIPHKLPKNTESSERKEDTYIVEGGKAALDLDATYIVKNGNFVEEDGFEGAYTKITTLTQSLGGLHEEDAPSKEEDTPSKEEDAHNRKGLSPVEEENSQGSESSEGAEDEQGDIAENPDITKAIDSLMQRMMQGTKPTRKDLESLARLSAGIAIQNIMEETLGLSDSDKFLTAEEPINLNSGLKAGELTKALGNTASGYTADDSFDNHEESSAQEKNYRKASPVGDETGNLADYEQTLDTTLPNQGTNAFQSPKDYNPLSFKDNGSSSWEGGNGIRPLDPTKTQRLSLLAQVNRASPTPVPDKGSTEEDLNQTVRVKAPSPTPARKASSLSSTQRLDGRHNGGIELV